MEQETVVESETQELQDSDAQAVDTLDGSDGTNENEVIEPETQEQPTEEAQPEQTEVAEVEEEEDTFDPNAYQAPPVPQVAAVDISQFIDENGQIDLVAYNQAIMNNTQAAIAAAVESAVGQSTQQVALQTRYDNEWAKAEKEFGWLKDNKELRQLVADRHMQSASVGRSYESPKKAAAAIAKLMNVSKAEGVKAAQQTRTVQTAATLTNPNPPAQATEQASISQTRDKIRNRTSGSRAEHESAVNDLLKHMIKNGTL